MHTMAFILYRHSLIVLSFFALSLYVWFATAANTPRDLILQQSEKALLQKQFSSTVAWVKIKEKSLVGLDSFATADQSSFSGAQNDGGKWQAEETFMVEIQLGLNEYSTTFTECRASHKIHCGWIMVNCFGNDSVGKQLSDYTQESRKILTHTYDPVKSSICIDKRTYL